MDVEKIFWAAQIVFLLVFAIGAANVLAVWRKGLPSPSPIPARRAGAVFRSLAIEGWFNRRLFETDKWRWGSHFLLVNGVLLLMSLSALSALLDKILPLFPGADAAALKAVAGRDQPVKAILNETGSLMMTLGWLFFAVRRYLFRPAQLRTNLRDHIPALGLGAILLTGWLLEAARINALQTPARASYIGSPLAQALSGLPLVWGEFFNGLFLFHGLLASLILSVAPHSKWLHTLAAGVTAALASVPARPVAAALPYTRRQRVELDACTRCGECIPWCPTYQEKPASQAITPLRKIEFVQRANSRRQGLLGWGGKELPAESWQEHSEGVFDCTLCGQCSVVCPAHIQTRELWISMRSELAGSGMLPPSIQRLRTTLAETRNLAGDAANDRLIWSQNLETPPPLAAPPGAVETLYFVGCVASQYPQSFSVSQSLVRLLDLAGERYGVLGTEEWCCGFPLITAGLRAEAAALARHNLQAVQRAGAKTLLTTCPSCYRTWKEEYPELLGESPDFEIVHASAWLAGRIETGGLSLRPLERTVTYHDPCDLGRGCGIYDAPRAVIQAVPGVRLVEMPHSRERALCCGGGGDVEMVDENLAASVALRRIAEAESSGAELLLTACQQCVRTLSAAARAKESAMQVLDLARFVARQAL